MTPFCLTIDAKPQPDNPQGKDLAGASVLVWVFAENETDAQTRAFSYIDEYGWTPIKVEFSFAPSAEQISGLDERELSNIRKAELHGIHAEFYSWPAEERPGVYSVESLQKPHKNDFSD